LTTKPLLELSVSSAPGYLAARGFDPESLHVIELAGGVSNIVLLVEHPGGRFVLKQALPQLRVQQVWMSDLRRIFNECAALRFLGPKLAPGSIPEVLFEDRANFAFAMTAAPEGSETWKAKLMRDEVDPRIAEAVGAMLGTLIRETWQSEAMAEAFGDLTIFDELRLDPYYRRLATVYPELRPYLDRLIHHCQTRRVSLVHGDWSPKNILTKDGAAMAIDFEAVHFGDPSFDSAFVLNHLLLKTFHGIIGAPELAATLWTSLQEQMPAASWFEAATIEHLGALLLARIDGKSPAEYIQSPELRDRIRVFARQLITDPPATIGDVWKRYAAEY